VNAQELRSASSSYPSPIDRTRGVRRNEPKCRVFRRIAGWHHPWL